MLLRFGVENYRSIRDYQELSLIASTIKDPWVELIEPDGINEKVLPAIGLYGSNASGKTTLLKSLHYFINLIKSSHKRSNPGDKFNGRITFALDPSYDDKPTKFDCDFMLDDLRYHYGFSMDSFQILDEWLYVFSSGGSRTTRKKLYYRDTASNEPIAFGKELKGLNRTVEEFTRKDSLFISAAAQNNHKQLTPIYEYFTKKINFRDADFRVAPSTLAKYLKNEEMRGLILEFLQLADVGITDAEIVETQTPEEIKPFVEELKALVKKQFPTDSDINFPEDEVSFDLKITHRGQMSDEVKFNLSDESSGTVAILGIIGPVFDSLKTGGVLVIDELNTNLHPLVSKQLIRLFSSKSTNVKFGQLIFATHDTNLLCSGVLRRDQVWFAEKDRHGASHIYPLTDIKTRQTDNIERGYLDGRFGAIPFFNNHFLDQDSFCDGIVNG